MTEQLAVTAGREQVVARLKDILADMVGVPVEGIDDNTQLFAQLGLDSTNALELLMTIEDEFGIEFDPGALQMENLESVGTLTSYLFDQSGL